MGLIKRARASDAMNEKPHQPKPKADMPPPRKPPGHSAVAGAADDRPKKHMTVRIALPPKPTQTPRVSPPTDSTT